MFVIFPRMRCSRWHGQRFANRWFGGLLFLGIVFLPFRRRIEDRTNPFVETGLPLMFDIENLLFLIIEKRWRGGTLWWNGLLIG